MLLPLRRAKQVASALSSLGLSPEGAAAALRCAVWDEEAGPEGAQALTPEQLDELAVCCPTEVRPPAGSRAAGSRRRSGPS
jgi:hypothetical protein